ncbi:hypothetical protein [Streptomyces sp. NPDC007205]|uniref:hypothetical protein n=1 Tax=Streptomyces sp. NPDC007205 TaxID=3154316 RepID=UPI0033ED07E6
MGDEFPAVDTEGEAAPETEPTASPGPLPLPEGAERVEGVTGYHALIKGGAVTVFGPDGAEIASGSRRDGVAVGRVGDTRLVSDGFGDRRLTAFAMLAARHHRAAADPSVRDRVWVRWEEDGVAAVYGTDKHDDDTRAVKAGNLYWSGQRQARVTGRKWNPGTRDRNLAAVLQAFARQDRNIVVLGPGQTPEDLAASPTTTEAAAVPAQQAPSAAAAPAPVPEPEPEPEDFTGLSYEDLVAAEDAAAMERAREYTTAAEGRYRALQQERCRRLLDRVATSIVVTELSDEDLAAESEWWRETIYRTPFHSADEGYRTLERRKTAVTTEQYVRTARAILAGPAVADLDDAALESAYEQIGPAWTRLPRDHELHDQVTGYRKALQEERIARRARSYGERTPVGEMALQDLIAESTELGSGLEARNEQSAYSFSEAVREARTERLKAIEAEWFQRGLEQHPEAARATLGSNLGGRRSVLIDGSERDYGYVERQGQKFRALANYDQRSSIGDFDSGPAAMAALVQRYDQDPETLPRRTWGLEREVTLPISSYDPLASWLRRRPSELSREFDRMLTILTPYQLPTQTKVLNPLTNQVMRAYPFYFEEGLLGELARIAERTTEDLREQSLNENLPKREREAAKRRIPAMGAALIGINEVIEVVRAAGGDVERRGVDQSRLAAQMAALAGTVDEQEGGEADGDDEPVRDAAAQALGGVQAAGAGADAGPGPLLPDAGDADERGDRRGGGGPGGEPGAGDGLRGAGRSDAADRGDGAGAGAARDAAAAGGRGGAGGAAESGSGGAGGDPQGAGEPVATRRFRPDPADLPRGPLARAEANLEAVKVLRRLERENRGTTVDEARTLARWSGWGSVPTVFLDEPDPEEPIYAPGGEWEGRFETDHARWESYSRVRSELRDLLDPFEWRAASRAVLSAHYTPQDVAESMWQGLAAYGFDGGEVLEAGCGSGVFFGVAPPTARLTGVELDPTTAAIAGRIYPHANVLPESFTDTDVALGTFDAVIGNVPFAQAPFGERRYRAGGHSLHNGFIIKQLALLRPGAYMAVITSRWTLDGEDTAARRDMSRWGDLAGAYRLPKGTFGETADTDVVADVLVFRRRAEGEEPGDLGWIEAPERELGGNTLAVNAYFAEHPENVLGRLTSETGPYGPRVTVQGDPGKASRLLRERMETTAAAAVADGLGYTHHEDWPHREPLLLQTARVKHATDFTGRLYTDDQGRIWQHVNGADPVRVTPADGVTGTEQLRMLLSLRDVTGELQELDRTGTDPDRANEVRGQLARLHAAYTAEYGPLSRPRQTRLALPTEEAAAAARDAGVDLDGEDRLPTGWGWFRQDPHAAVVLGLEHWDRANNRPVPSEVLTRRPGARRGDLEPTEDPKTALTAVMGATGRVDLPLIASLLGTIVEEARLRLGTEVFDNPVTKKLEHAGAYLSGPVRQKLDEAREAATTDPTYAVNVAALEAVQPTPKRLGQFTAQLGAHWIPAPLVQGFLREYLGDPTLQVSHNERYGWSLAAGKVPDAINALKGTERRSAVHIAKALLGRASMVVNQLDGVGVDEDATRAMRYKADAMRSAFEDYCTASTARVTLLTDAYNRQMNGHVVRNYDSLAPTLEGFTTERTPHPWQLSGAARMQFERGVVLAHEVGLGKTTTMVMGSQALKASGQIGKPFAVVQPHLARQWLDEARLIYPNADIHLITSDDLADGNRRPVLEWLRANSPDLVIFTEGAFGSIRMSPEQQELYLFREIESLKEQLKRERGVPHNNFALMQLERRLTTVEARIRRNDAPMRTPGEVYWDDLGFDYACIDEAHRFTAVGFRSKEAGGETASVRAVDLHQKLSWHHRMAEYDGGRPTVTLGTGTPMENSIFEQYSVLELATPWLLDQFGVHGPDLWSETFGQKVQRIEMAPDGSGLTIVERFSRFVSKSTMKTMWGLAADTKTGDEVGIERPRLAGGAPELVLVEPTADQSARLQSLVARGQAIHAGNVTRDEDNMLAVSGEGRAVALDPRLVDANAPAANKLVEAADIIAAAYHAHKDHTYAVSSRDDTPHPVPGGLFFVFCNSGTPGGNNKGGFDLYAELRDLLADRGVPRDLVEFAQDNATPEKKAAMSAAANNGGIAVLMGSTEVLGTGFNGQNRAYALMHLDQDWTPASMIQRNGRVIRPGNQHEEVDIYFLATKGSMDAWQVGLLTSKAEGLRDIQRPPGVGDDDNDTVEEIGASDWDYATMAAEIGGNPFMKQFMEAKIHLQGLESDRRNAAADRVRQAELLLAKETELSSTQHALAARDAALPKVTATIRGDAFRIRIGSRDFDQRGEAGPVLRQAVADALRGQSSLGMGPWTKLGTFGGLDFAVQPEILNGGAEIRAHVGFPDLRHSESVCSIGDLANPRFGATIIGRLATALEKAEDHQLMDRERLPVLDAEITLLTAQQAAVEYGQAIEHARRRVELLDAVVGAITERDKLPELTESMLDPERYRSPESRQKAIRERAEQRAPHQAKVDQAAAALAAYDQTTPAPELPTAPAPAPAPAPTPDATVSEPTSSSVDRTANQAQAPSEPDDDSTQEPTAQATEPPGDEYGTADLYETFGLSQPERVPAPAPQDEPDPGTEAEDSAVVPDGQMTVEEVQPQEEPAVLLAAVRADDARAWRPDPSATAETVLLGDVEQSAEVPAPDRPTDPTRTQEGGSVASQSAETEQLGLFGDPTPDATDNQAEPDAARPAAADSEEAAPDNLLRAQLAMTEVTGAAGIRYSLYGSQVPGEPETVEFHVVRVFRGVTGIVDYSGTREECLAYIESEAAIRSAAEAVGENSEQQAAALAWLREQQAPARDPAVPEETALPDLDMVLLDVDVPALDPAEPYATDAEAQADIDRLDEVFAHWAALPSVQRYYEADRQQRPDGNGDPTNPVVQLAEAYRDAERTLREGPVGSPDDLVRQVHTVAAWSGALEPVVGEDLRGPLGQVRDAAGLLAARSRATVESFEAELAALAANSAGPIAGMESEAAETEPAEQGEATSLPPQAPVNADAQAETRPEPEPGEPAADTRLDRESSATGPAEPERPAPAAEPLFKMGDRVYLDGEEYTVSVVSEDGTILRTPLGTELVAAEVTREYDMPPVTREKLADGWWQYSYRDRTYTLARLPDELARGRLATLPFVIVDENNDLVGRSFGVPPDSRIIWAYHRPGVLHSAVVSWWKVGGDTTPLPEYTAAERAYMEAGPPVTQMSLDLDAPAQTTTAAETDAATDDDPAPEPGPDPRDVQKPAAAATDEPAFEAELAATSAEPTAGTESTAAETEPAEQDAAASSRLLEEPPPATQNSADADNKVENETGRRAAPDDALDVGTTDPGPEPPDQLEAGADEEPDYELLYPEELGRPLTDVTPGREAATELSQPVQPLPVPGELDSGAISGVAETPELEEDSAVLRESAEADDSAEPAVEQDAAPLREGMAMAEEPQESALPPIPEAPVLDPIDDAGTEAAAVRADARVDGLRALWTMGPVALGLPESVHGAVGDALRQAGERVAAEAAQYRAQDAAVVRDILAGVPVDDARQTEAVAVPAEEPQEASDAVGAAAVAAAEQPVSAPAERADQDGLSRLIGLLQQVQAEVDATLDSEARQWQGQDNPLGAFTRGIAQLSSELDPPGVPQPTPDLGLNGFGEVEQAYATASQHAPEFNGAREWRQLTQLWQNSQRVWSNARDALSRSTARQATGIRAVCRNIGARVADGVARLSHKLAMRLANAGRHGSPGYRALRWLSGTAENVASHLRGPKQAERMAQIEDTLRDLSTQLQAEMQNTQAQAGQPTMVEALDNAARLVDESFAGAERHTREYNGAPEWRRLTNMWPVARRVLGEDRAAAATRYGTQLSSDIRWQGALRTVGVTTLETVARLSYRMAERLANADRDNSPGRRAIQDLGHTAQRAVSEVREDAPADSVAALDRFAEAVRDIDRELAEILGDEPGHGAGVPFGEPSRPVLTESKDQKTDQKVEFPADGRDTRFVSGSSRRGGSGVGE